MKKRIRKIIIIKLLLVFPLVFYAQTTSVKKVFAAETEEEMYKLYTQFIDSSYYYKQLSFSYIYDFNCYDTIMKVEQLYGWHDGFAAICEQNRNRVYISSNMPVDFYERFYYYLDSLGQNKDYFNYFFSVKPLYFLRRNFIKLYESGKLNKEDSIKTFDMIEKVSIKIIKDKYSFTFLYFNDVSKYMTANIRQALIDKINNPFYPEFLFDYYINNIVDTSELNISNIPIEIKERYRKKGYLANEFDLEKKYGFETVSKYGAVLDKYYHYKKIGDKVGITPGHAYLEEKADGYRYKGYLNINAIADYVKKRKDSIIIPYLESFLKNNPKYKLKPFK